MPRFVSRGTALELWLILYHLPGPVGEIEVVLMFMFMLEVEVTRRCKVPDDVKQVDKVVSSWNVVIPRYGY